MERQRLIQLITATWSSVHDLKWKLLTIDCPDCPFFFSDPEVAPSVKLCLWGLAIKQLAETEKPRRCEYFRKPSPREELITHYRYQEEPLYIRETLETYRNKLRELGLEALLDQELARLGQ